MKRLQELKVNVGTSRLRSKDPLDPPSIEMPSTGDNVCC